MLEQFVDGHSIRYRLDGKLHRANGPAIIWSESSWVWHRNGERHRYYGYCTSYGGWYMHGRVIK